MEDSREDDRPGRRTIGRLVVALAVAVTGGVVPVAAQPVPVLMAVPAQVAATEPSPLGLSELDPVAILEPLPVEPAGQLQEQAVPRGLGGGEGLPGAPEPVPSDEETMTGFQRSARPVQATLAEAYLAAVDHAPAGCHLPVSLLAAIGEVESGSLRGRSITTDHRAYPPVYGPALNGVGFASIPDTDGGALDSDVVWDRAVGPLQFIPGTWRAYGTDGDGDGRADPQNVFDAAASAGRYLCAGGRDLATSEGLRAAILSYNYSEEYLIAVLGWKAIYERSGALPITPTVRVVAGGTRIQQVAARSSLPAPDPSRTATPAAPTATAASVVPEPLAQDSTPTPSMAEIADPTPPASPEQTATPTPTPEPTPPPTPTPTPTSTPTPSSPPTLIDQTEATPTPTPPVTECEPSVSELPPVPLSGPAASGSGEPSAAPSAPVVDCP